MTVSTITSFVRRPWGGAPPPFPSGIWVAGETVTGNVSGGFRQVQILFNEAPTWSQIVSLESYSFFTGEAAAGVVEIVPSGFDNDLDPGVNDVSFVPIIAGVDRTSQEPNMVRSMFLGRGKQGTTNSVIFRTVNVDAVTFQVKAHGYIWDAQSLAIPGGPRKPPGGLITH